MRPFHMKSHRAVWLLALIVAPAVMSGCSYTRVISPYNGSNTCDERVLESIYKTPRLGSKRPGFVEDLKGKLERFLLQYEECAHSFEYEYFIDRNYSGSAPGLIVRVSVEYEQKDVARGCVESSFAKYCFSARGRLELVSERDESGR